MKLEKECECEICAYYCCVQKNNYETLAIRVSPREKSEAPGAKKKRLALWRQACEAQKYTPRKRIPEPREKSA